MATLVSTRDLFKSYCLRRLGFPVIEINVDDDQVEDRIDDALQYWQDYHFDALQKVFYIKRLDATDITNKYINMSPDVTRDTSNASVNIIGVTRIFPISDSIAQNNMFDLRYQLRLNELYDFTSASYINYTLTMQHLRSLEQMFTGEVPIRFQRHMHKLFCDWGWGTSVNAGTVVIAECHALIKPEDYISVWNDRWLKEYATALIKRNWGANLMKFQGVQLPGGVMLNGDKIFEEANAEVLKLEQEMLDSYSLPVDFYLN
jgi:hypothetical protein